MRVDVTFSSSMTLTEGDGNMEHNEAHTADPP